MNGEFKGDFSRDGFDPKKHFRRVLSQQGRVQLDSDLNEQTDLLLHYLQTLAADIIGPYGRPEKCGGFVINAVEPKEGDFTISKGHYYVDGILCENDDGEAHYKGQLSGLDGYNKKKADGKTNYIVYLDVWERQVTFIEDGSILEVALGGPDTSTRSKVEWMVRSEPTEEVDCQSINKNFKRDCHNGWPPNNRGKLKARAMLPPDSNYPCIIRPEAKYRGSENHLYRVEIHRSGTAFDKSNKSEAATFKWSRDNGSVVFPILTVSNKAIALANLGKDRNSSLAPGNWVELLSKDLLRSGQPGPLAEVDSVNLVDMTITFKDTIKDCPGYDANSQGYWFLRRWDHVADPEGCGALIIREDSGSWIDLEDGVQIQFQFQQSEVREPNHYRTGDYWLIPARVATGDVEWPGSVKDPEALPPHGIEHHYAPLAVIVEDKANDCGCTFSAMSVCSPPS
jgi:hypothetical protein